MTSVVTWFRRVQRVASPRAEPDEEPKDSPRGAAAAAVASSISFVNRNAGQAAGGGGGRVARRGHRHAPRGRSTPPPTATLDVYAVVAINGHRRATTCRPRCGPTWRSTRRWSSAPGRPGARRAQRCCEQIDSLAGRAPTTLLAADAAPRRRRAGHPGQLPAHQVHPLRPGPVVAVPE